MNGLAAAAVLAGASYLLGAFPSASVYGKLVRPIDIREHGSGNIGAANTFRVLGPAAGLVVLAADAAKGWAAVAVLAPRIAGLPASGWLAVLAGAAAIAGHNWTVFLRFRGGRGVATTAGVFLALAPQALAAAVAAWVVMILATRIVSVASISAALVLVLGLCLTHVPLAVMVFGAVAGSAVVARHAANLKRLRNGTEPRITLMRKRRRAQG